MWHKRSKCYVRVLAKISDFEFAENEKGVLMSVAFTKGRTVADYPQNRAIAPPKH